MNGHTNAARLSRLVALVVVLVVALAIAPGIAWGAHDSGPMPNIMPGGAAGGASCTGVSGEFFSYEAVEYTDSGWVFSEWELTYDGGTTKYGSEKKVDAPKEIDGHGLTSVTAYFKQKKPTPPTAVVNPSGAGTVTSEPAGDGGTAYTATANEGWQFASWTLAYEGGNTFDVDENPVNISDPENLASLTANFKSVAPAPTTYKVSVTAEPAEGGTAEASAAEAAEGADVKLTAVANDGYEFVAWKTDPSDLSIVDGAFTMPASNVTATAVFQKKDAPTPATTYTITFDANGGTGSMDTQTVEAGTTVTLATNAYVRDGYSFSSWNTAQDGSGTTYADGAEVAVESNLTLYAQWTARENPSPSPEPKPSDPASETKPSEPTPKAKPSESVSTNKLPQTSDATAPLTSAAVVVAAIAGGILFAARRRMER